MTNPRPSRAPGQIPVRVAGLGDRWKISVGRHPHPTVQVPMWYARPVEENVWASPQRKHALFYSHSDALAYTTARAAGKRHHDVAQLEFHTVHKTTGLAKAAARRAGYASREA